MKRGKRVLQGVLAVLSLPLLYIVLSLVFSWITIDRKIENQDFDKTIYLSTNGVHLDIVLPMENIDSLLLARLVYSDKDSYLSFGWGDENFYINTPTWGDLTFTNAFSALFLQSSTLMHLTRHTTAQTDWIPIKISTSELDKLNAYLITSFKTLETGEFIHLAGQGYSAMDDFYKANGSYSCFKTCNSWVNTGFKESGLKSCLWTPFDFGLMNKYE